MVFGLFSKEKALQRNIDKATNKLSQQADRWAAMEALNKDGSEEALYGLCRRFSIISHKGVEDEQEKAWVVDVLVAKGERALKPLRRYFKNNGQWSFGLKVLGQIVPRDRVLEVLDELIAHEPAGYTRDPEPKLDLLKWIHEWEGGASPDLIARIAPYLKDHSEEVRYFAAEALVRIDPGQVGDQLIAALTNPEEEAGRFKRRVAELLAEHKVPLGERAPSVQGALAGPALQGFAVRDGLVVGGR